MDNVTPKVVTQREKDWAYRTYLLWSDGRQKLIGEFQDYGWAKQFHATVIAHITQINKGVAPREQFKEYT